MNRVPITRAFVIDRQHDRCSVRADSWCFFLKARATGQEPAHTESTSTRLIDISLDHNIEQTIDKPTRGGNILDLLFTNNKSTLQHLQLGKSDHDIIYAEINVRPNRVCTPHRKVFSFRKANWDGIKRKLNALFEKMQENSKQPPSR